MQEVRKAAVRGGPKKGSRQCEGSEGAVQLENLRRTKKNYHPVSSYECPVLSDDFIEVIRQLRDRLSSAYCQRRNSKNNAATDPRARSVHALIHLHSACVAATSGRTNGCRKDLLGLCLLTKRGGGHRDVFNTSFLTSFSGSAIGAQHKV